MYSNNFNSKGTLIACTLIAVNYFYVGRSELVSKPVKEANTNRDAMHLKTVLWKSRLIGNYMSSFNNIYMHNGKKSDSIILEVN